MKCIASLFPFLLAATTFAQEPEPPLSKEFFAGRRAALAEAVAAQTPEGRRSVVLLRGAPKPGNMALFGQSHEFWYLTGVAQEDVAMLLFPDSRRDVLLVHPFNRLGALYDGHRLVPGEAAATASGFAEVGNVRSLKSLLDEALAPDADGVRPVLWTLLQPSPGPTASARAAAEHAAAVARDPFDGRLSREAALAGRLKAMYPDVAIEDVAPLLDAMRLVKTPDEVRSIRAASRIAVAGIGDAMRAVRPGDYEFQLAAVARYAFSRHGAGPDAYAAIVGAGRNGCILHYRENAKRIEAGDLIVMDYAPMVNGYCADVTRTFPASGTFTPEQRKLVQDVYEVQQAILAAIKPGARLSQLDSIGNRELVARGYRRAHGPCHHVGLAVHDVHADVLLPGMVITVEPGAYLVDREMGCRIEDMVLITEDGYELLSGGLPSTPDAIEAFVRERSTR